MQQAVDVAASILRHADLFTYAHDNRVGQLACGIARELGWSAERAQAMLPLGLLHDIGKLAIPNELLTKPARLSAAEFAVVQQHPEIGAKILRQADADGELARVLLQHHERVDGSGYPHGLRGEQISEPARVLAVADVIDAMSQPRPYRPGLGLATALDEIISERGRRYDSAVADAALRLLGPH